MSARFSGPVSIFHNRRLPEAAVPAGYAALIDAYKLSVPVPLTLSAIGTKHRINQQGGGGSTRHAMLRRPRLSAARRARDSVYDAFVARKSGCTTDAKFE